MPRRVAKLAASAAMVRLRPSASMICSLANSEAYQRVEKPPQTVAMREALNEYTATERIGTYRKA